MTVLNSPAAAESPFLPKWIGNLSSKFLEVKKNSSGATV
jgi:hypothetical protein